MDPSSLTVQIYSAMHRDAHEEMRPFLTQKSVILGNPYLLHDYLDNKLQKKERPSLDTIRLLLNFGVNPSYPKYQNRGCNDALDIARKFDDKEVREQVIATIDLYTHVLS